MIKLRDIALAAGLSLFAGCAGVQVVNLTPENVNSTPENLTVDIKEEKVRFVYDGKDCYWENTELFPTGELVNKYDVKLKFVINDYGCDNHFENMMASHVVIPKGGHQQYAAPAEKMKRHEFPIKNRNDVDSGLKELRERYSLDKLMNDWDKTYK